MTDGRRPSGDRLFEARLKAAASSLADEPLPDDILDVTEHVSSRRWRATPLAMAAAAGILAIAIGAGLSQSGPRHVADASPSHRPSVRVPTTSPNASATPSEFPTPAASVDPTADPALAFLVEGGSACGDGAAGYAFMVPDGWYANRRVGESPACRYVADSPFEVRFDGGPIEAPIALRVSEDAIPTGDASEVGSGIPTETPNRLATRYAVDRAGVTYTVFVVPLHASVDGPAANLHLEAEASRTDTVATLERIVARTVVREPMATSADVVAQVDALYAEAKVDGCINVELGFATSFPESWWTNTPVEAVPGCVYLAPTSFEIPDDPTQVPDGVAITVRLFDGSVGSFEEVTGYESLVVDGRPAVRSELAATTYKVHVQLGPIEEVGPNLVLTTDDDPLHRAVLDRVVELIRVSPPPPEVVERDPLPSCGQDASIRLPGGDTADLEARECFWAAYQAGDPAEFVELRISVEGHRNLSIWRVIGPGEVDLYSDPTHDYVGGTIWQLFRCRSIDGVRDADGVLFFGMNACDPPIDLETRRSE